MDIGLQWKLRRIAAGLRQQDLARRTGMPTSLLSAIERGDRAPSALECSLVDKVLPPLVATLKRLVVEDEVKSETIPA
jgi:transcriptional regulator with XRE-family HTH domain